jgi:polycystin 1L2
MSVDGPLGDLSFMRIWHNNSGKTFNRASWYLKYVIVHDLQTREKFYFICNSWLSASDSVEKLLTVAGRKQETELKYLLKKETKERLSDNHLWVSLVSKPTLSSFYRVDRLTCCFVLLFLTMLVDILYYEQDTSSHKNMLKIGPFYLTQAQIVIGFVTDLVVFTPSFIIIQLFRRSKGRNSKYLRLLKTINDLKERQNLKRYFFFCYKTFLFYLCSSGFYFRRETLSQPVTDSNLINQRKKRTRLFFPWWAKILAYILSAICVIVSGVFVVFKGISLGDEKCGKWLTSFVISILSSCFITQPIQVSCLEL